MKRPIKTLALFSGGGGLDLGFSAAGFSIVLTTDNDPYSCKTLEINQGKKKYYDKHPVLLEDISKLTFEQIKKIANVKANEIDFIIGGPPCQSFSISGLRAGLDDPRGNLIWEYARIVKEVNPKGFLFENVSGLRTIDDGRVFDELLETLSFNGKYQISAHTYQVADYGIPQFRERVIIIGNRLGKDVPKMSQTHSSKATVGLQPHRTVSEALRFLPEYGTSNFNAHTGRKHSDRIIQRYEELAPGERDPKTRINKLNPMNPSFAIIVGSNHGGGKGHVHPYEPREVSPRESARMQTFPDWWHFDGVGRHLIRQVGNAVPVLFGALIASHVMKHLFDEPRPLSYKQAIRRLDLNYLEHDYGPIQSQNTLKWTGMAG